MMTDKDILLDLLHHFVGVVDMTIRDLPQDALRWQPDGEANNIAVTVWHISRALDILAVRILDTQPPEAELWYTAGWSRQTGYDPRGLGIWGMGNLSGYTREEVAGVPILTSADLLRYLDQVSGALQRRIETMPTEALYEIAATWTPFQQTAYVWIRDFLMDTREHLGEIKAIRAMWKRQAQA